MYMIGAHYKYVKPLNFGLATFPTDFYLNFRYELELVAFSKYHF